MFAVPGDPSNTIMERLPCTGISMYHQSTAPAPTPDLPPVVAPASVEPVPAAGPPLVLLAVVRPHVVPTHTAQMVPFAQAMCKPAQVVQMWVVIILRNACMTSGPEVGR